MAGKDGWIRHRGVKCPVDAGEIVDVRYRDGTFGYRLEAGRDYSFATDHHSGWDAHFEYWKHDNMSGDIMAWRPSIIEEGKQEMAVAEMTIKLDTKDAIAAVDAEVARHVADHPFTWRDRIREIDAQQIALTNERAELVAKLATEGLALCAGHDIADEPMKDMDNPANWKAGDLIEIIGSDSHHFDIGEIVRLNVYERDHASDGHRYEHLDKSDYWWVKDVNAKFHSRP